MEKIKTKKQYDNAKFLGKSLRHSHNWKRMRIQKGRKKKMVSDETGGFLQCSICGKCAFVPPKQLDKYRTLRKQGVPTSDIVLSFPKTTQQLNK